MQRSIQQLVAVFILLSAIAWWITGRVAVSHSVREFFLGDEETSTQPETSLKEQEKSLVDKVFAELPPPPEEHSPEVMALITRLNEIQIIPTILVKAVQRDRDTPKDQIPAPWSEAELEALRDYQIKFQEAWEPFLSGPAPDWAKFPDSAILSRSQYPPLASEEQICYGFYKAEQPESWAPGFGAHTEFYLRLFRQCTNLGTLRFGTLSGWGLTDTVFVANLTEMEIRSSDYFFSPQSKNPEEIIPLVSIPPSVTTLRRGLKTDRAVFLRTAQYLESLPPQTPAKIGLIRFLGNEGDADWFITHVDNPQYARDLAAILREGAAQIGTLDQKTYLAGPAWRQWLAGDLNG